MAPGSTRPGKRPSFQWYPGDAQRDTALRACCLEARGLWREMLDLMHDGEPYGHLTAGGVPIAPAELARIVGITTRRAAALLHELESRGVFERTADGVMFSRRMVRDEHNRNARGAGGGRSLENPNVPRPKDGDKDGGKVSLPASFDPSPATAIAVAVATEVVDGALNRFAAATNKGLAEHPVTPQLVPRIMASGGRTRQATEIILAAQIPVEFAEAEIYRLAKSHGADGQVTSLNYFVGGVCRAWEQQAMAGAARASKPKLVGAQNPEALAAFDRATALIKEHGDLRFVPTEKAQDLYKDERMARALKAIGGLPGIRDCKPEKVVWLKRDFVDAYQKAGAA